MIPLLLLLSTANAEDTCSVLTDAYPDGPVQAGFQDGNLGGARPLCPRTAVGLAVNGYLVADTANFYGHVVAGGHADGSWAVNEDLSLFANLELVRYDYVIGAISSSWVGTGHTRLGLTRRMGDNGHLAWGLTASTVLPTAIGLYDHAPPLGLDVGVQGLWTNGGSLRAHGQVGALASGTLSSVGLQPRAGERTNLGLEWRPVKAFGLAVDVDAGFAYVAPVDHVAAGLGLRFGLGPRGGLGLDLAYPFAGRERALASVSLGGTWRLGGGE